MSDGNSRGYRLEHALSDKAGCYNLDCKREDIKIPKGELRYGTLHWSPSQENYIVHWYHWRCCTPSQIKELKTKVSEDSTKYPDLDQLSEKSRKQVGQALLAEKVDENFSDIRADLVKKKPTPVGTGEIEDATGYKVEVSPNNRGLCRKPECKENGVKIKKGELRVGISTTFQGHDTVVYKHWACIDRNDMNNTQASHETDTLEGFEELDEEFQNVILESFKTGKAVAPPTKSPEPVKPATSKKTAGRKRKMRTVDDEENAEEQKPVRQKRTKKT